VGYFGRNFFSLLFMSFFLQSCLVQQAPERGMTSPGNNSTPNQTNTLGLWSRSPVQSAGYLVDAGDNLEILNRQSVVLYDLLSSNGNLNGSTVNVYYSPNDKNSPRLNAYGSSKIPWSNKDFQAYMVYAHTSGAYRYIQSLFPDIKFEVNGKNLFPVPAFALVKGSPFETGYIVNYSSSQLGALMFYGEDDPSFPYNVSDEADVIYHEVAHSFQHVLNPSVMETPGYYDMDMLLEALADFFAASALRDDKILLYLEANSPSYGADRNGSNQIRRLDGSLSFPKSYVGEYHLDGRVIASALNDVRKYLTNQIVIVSQPTSKSLRWLASKPLTTSQAFDKVLVSSHEALRVMLPTSTVLFFTQKFLDNLMEGDWSVYCGVDLSCENRLRSDVISILVSRGIYKSSNDLRSKSFSVGLLDDMGINPSGAEIIFDKTLKFFPLSPSNGYSNVDASVDKCEALLVTPNFYLASGVAHSVYDTLFRLKSSLGLSSYRSIDLLSASSTSSAKTLKLFGFILPGEDTFEAITSNRFYDDHQGSHLTSTSLSPENPSALGWAARAPAVLYPNDRSNTGRGAITYEMSFRPFELLNAPNSVYSVLNITQSVYVSGTANFCSKN
jgi:hypothetical protein